MEQRRLFPLAIFVLSLIMLWTNWIAYNRPAAPASANPAGAAPSSVSAQAPDDTVPTPGHLVTPSLTPAEASTPRIARIRVSTDVMRADISAEGGNIIRLELVQHKSTSDPEKSFVIFDDGGEHLYEAESGLLGANLPNHRTLFTLPSGDQTLADGQEKLELKLEAPTVNGVTVTKRMTFTRGSYLVDVAYEIRNQSGEALTAQAYFQFLRDGKPAEQVTSGFGSVQTFTGPAFYTDHEKFQKVTFEEIAENKAKFAHDADNGWVAMVQHYFVSAWLPPKGIAREYLAKKTNSGNYTAGLMLAPITVAPDATSTVETQLYVGPQDQNKLENIAEGLNLVVDYGILTVIAAPLFWLLSKLHSLTGNWGWAIIFVTIIIKALFFPLSAASYKSMAKMRVLAPRLQRLKEVYGSDKARMQQEMMKIYRDEKINPLGGCLPILVQIPVFIALYWVLLGSAEMRQAPWLGWIQDLSARDPYFILPLILGASMLIQPRLNPTPPAPFQAKVMMAMPIVFTVMFLWFPSGLVLYWVVNNLLSIAQQWQITRMIERGGKKVGKAANDQKI